ncbi:MAG TPA: hypothetical protein VGN34_27185, partial [Ktedonobacteraceae bacterium]
MSALPSSWGASPVNLGIKRLMAVVLQEMGRNKDERGMPLLFSLGSHSKESGDQCSLPFYISFI